MTNTPSPWPDTVAILNENGIVLDRPPLLELYPDHEITVTYERERLWVGYLHSPFDVVIPGTVHISYSTHSFWDWELVGRISPEDRNAHGEERNFSRTIENPTVIDLLNCANDAVWETRDNHHCALPCFRKIISTGDGLYLELEMDS